MLRGVAVLGVVMLGLGCDARYEGLTFSRIEGPPEAKVDENGIELTAGRAVKFTVRPRAIDERRDYDVTDEVDLDSTASSVARVEEGVKVDSWVILGVSAGDAELEVRINGEVEDHIPLTILAAPILDDEEDDG